MNGFVVGLVCGAFAAWVATRDYYRRRDAAMRFTDALLRVIAERNDELEPGGPSA